MTSHIVVMARAIANGYSYGPRNKCACCHGENTDADAVCRGICAQCWETIEIHIKLEREV